MILQQFCNKNSHKKWLSLSTIKAKAEIPRYLIWIQRLKYHACSSSRSQRSGFKEKKNLQTKPPIKKQKNITIIIVWFESKREIQTSYRLKRVKLSDEQHKCKHGQNDWGKCSLWWRIFLSPSTSHWNLNLFGAEIDC